jgi:putative zinc finger/helix-turn-helix YgiT family protein
MSKKGVIQVKTYCPDCDKETSGRITKKEEVFPVKEEKIKIVSSVLLCDECGSDVFNEEIDGKNIEAAYNEYRRRHNLLLPFQVREIREKYGLSQRSLSSLLRWGEITVHRYEAGGLQDEVHDKFLKLIAEPINMAIIVEENEKYLPEYLRVRLKEKIKEILKEESEPKLKIAFDRYFECRAEINEFSGYKKFDIEKMKNMILYILEKVGGTYKTKINKLLWYIDFFHFKEHSTSISGSVYVHLPLGPIFDDYKWIISEMLQENLIEAEEVTWDDISGERLKPLVHYAKDFFSKEEFESMNFILCRLGKFTASKLKDRSHDEVAYRKTNDNEKISYNFAKEIDFNCQSI